MKCTDESCDTEATRRGLCSVHLRRAKARRYYDANKEVQSVRHAAYMRSHRGRFVTSRINAKATGRAWGIAYEDFVALIAKPCDYCGLPLNETGCGLDRLDNSVGYELSNVVPCCRDCNILRGNRLTPTETRVLATVLRAMRSGATLDMTGTGVTWVHTTSAP